MVESQRLIDLSFPRSAWEQCTPHALHEEQCSPHTPCAETSVTRSVTSKKTWVPTQSVGTRNQWWDCASLVPPYCVRRSVRVDSSRVSLEAVDASESVCFFPERGGEERRGRLLRKSGNASVGHLPLRDETDLGETREDGPVGVHRLPRQNLPNRPGT